MGLTKSLAKELGSRSITVNAIAPGYIETDMTDNLSENVKNELYQNIPLNRLGTTDDVTNLVLFLSSEKAIKMYKGCSVDGFNAVLLGANVR